MIYKVKKIALLIVGLVCLSSWNITAQCTVGDLDSDADGICDIEDKDDDNDGILDEKETVCSASLTDFTFYGDAISSVDANTIYLNSPGAWRTSYSNETLSLPVHIKFLADKNHYKMIGFLPIDATERVDSWNGGGYKLYTHQSDIVYAKLPNQWTFILNGIDNKVMELDISETGRLTVTLEGTVIYTGTAPVNDYRLAVSANNGGTFEDVVITYKQPSCNIQDIDTDGDNIPNRLDLDSDGDNCVDAFEGDAEFGLNDMDGNGRLTGGVDTNPASPTYGVPMIATNTLGQGIGESATTQLLNNDSRECMCIASNNPTDADNDGICAAVDICDNIPNNQLGTPCNDGDNSTINDIWDDVTCSCTGTRICVPGDLDTDADGVCDIEDQDDDNDGILDENETVCNFPLQDLDIYGDAVDSVGLDKIFLTANNAWRSSYSTEIFSLPIHLEFRADVSTLKMIGFLPLGHAERVGGYEDSAYKLYIHTNSRVYGKLPYAWNFWTGIANEQLIEMDIDLEGNLTVKANERVVYTGIAPISDYRLAITSHSGGSFDDLFIAHGNIPCQIQELDTDEDTTPNRLDLDSDNDNCVDAYEGTAEFGLNDMDGNGRLLGGIDTDPQSPAYGVPLLADTLGQEVGNATIPQDVLVDFRECMCIAANNPTDTDNDGICDDIDTCDNLDNALIGTSCNDGNSNTINDTWQSTCECAGTPTCTPGATDTDADGICDVEDKDDDNDGILDENETTCGMELTNLSTDGTAIDSIFPNKILLTDNNDAWRTSYSVDTFSLPIHLEFSINIDDIKKMIGFLPLGAKETETNYNDEAYKLYISGDTRRLYGKLPGAWALDLAITDLFFKMDIDIDGNLSVKMGDNEVYAATVPITDYRLAVTSYNGGSFENLVINHKQIPCVMQDLDTDGDGTPNRLDLDSDGDLCVDAFEGDADFELNDMDADGRLTGGIDTNPTSPTYGAPIVADTLGQGIGESTIAYTPEVEFRECICIAANNPTDSDGDGICDAIDDAPVIFSPEGQFFHNNITTELSTTIIGAAIHYTIDGSAPDLSSPIYNAPITMDSTTQIKAIVAYPSGGISSTAIERYVEIANDLANFDSNLPIILIETYNTGINRIDQTTTFASIIEPDAATGRAQITDAPTYSGLMGLNVRGASSAGFPKKQYKVETWNENKEDIDVEILGMPAESDWILSASGGYDNAYLQNPLMYHMAREMGRYAPRTEFVEVYINQNGDDISSADYVGLYAWTEKIKRDKDRVDIAKLKPDENTHPDITGGYMFKIESGNITWVTDSIPRIEEIYPKVYESSDEQKNYIRTYIQDLENTVFSDDWLDPDIGYKSYIDLESFVWEKVMRIFAKDPDGMGLSSYYYKDKDGPLKAGPIWDFDRTMNSLDSRDDIPDEWFVNDPPSYFNLWWWTRMTEDPDWRVEWHDQWFEQRREGVFHMNAINHVIDSMAAIIDEAEDRNYNRWNGTHWLYAYRYDGTFESEVEAFRDWIDTRVHWIDSQLVANPDFSHPSGLLPAGTSITLTNTHGSGVIYYTVDGTDPRLPGGALSSSAMQYTNPIPVNGVAEISARIFVDGLWGEELQSPWGAICTQQYQIPQDYSAVIINEIMYHPDSLCAPAENDELDFVEITNSGNSTVNLSFAKFTKGIDYNFPFGSILAPGQFLVVAENKPIFDANYNTIADGQFKGTLSNSGDSLVLKDMFDNVIDIVDFNDKNPWDEHPDGQGSSLELLDPNSDNDDPINWFRSDNPCGTPGAANSRICTSTADIIVINEINYNSNNGVTDPGDWVELYNPTANAIDISDWIFYDNKNEFIIPSGTIIQPDDYLVLVEDAGMFTPIFPHLTANDYLGNFAFNLSSKGERISLFDKNKCLSDYVVYNDKIPWDTIPDGNGPTLSLITPNSDNTQAQSWEASSNINSAYGTPGRINAPCLEQQIVIPDTIYSNWDTLLTVDIPSDEVTYAWFISGIASAGNNDTDSLMVNWVNPGTYNIQLITRYFECVKVLFKQIVVVESPCMDIQINAWLEGAYNPMLGEMRTTLSANRKLLPGQTPASNLAIPTPAGQPYSAAPWNYTGTEGASWTNADYTGDETDWILTSFRTGTAKNTEVGMTAGLLMKDGSITFPDRCALLSSVASPLYIVLEHRNHIGVMTSQPIDVINGTLTYDFCSADSYRDPTSFGQKLLPTGEWAMFAGDAEQSDFPSFDIKGTDKTIWFNNNGVFDYYFSPDFNLDGDINGQDKSLWFENNGISSRVPK